MSMTKINWYPGHMKKAKDMMIASLDVIDIVIEVLDARIPLSSKNPEIEKIIGKKKHVIALNKIDLVDNADVKTWCQYFIDKKLADDVIGISAEKGTNLKPLFAMIDNIAKDKREKYAKKGINVAKVRLLIVGIPNVGKSQLINKLVGKKSAKVENRPGVTRGKQWVKINENLELLDTPGILWPKFQSEEVGYNLAITGAIKDNILPTEKVACKFIEKILKCNIKNTFVEKYSLSEDALNGMPEDILSEIAKKKGFLKKGGIEDVDKASFALLKDYRDLKLGKIVLDDPEQQDFEEK